MAIVLGRCTACLNGILARLAQRCYRFAAGFLAAKNFNPRGRSGLAGAAHVDFSARVDG